MFALLAINHPLHTSLFFPLGPVDMPDALFSGLLPWRQSIYNCLEIIGSFGTEFYMSEIVKPNGNFR